VNLWTQIERWASYWKHVTDPVDVERALERLRWLEEFAFRCGPEIPLEYFQALQQQIEFAERKLADLGGLLSGGPAESVLRPETDAGVGALAAGGDAHGAEGEARGVHILRSAKTRACE
jgi:hypothetical protein